MPSLEEQRAKNGYIIMLGDKTPAKISAFSDWLEKTHKKSRGARNGTFTGISTKAHFPLIGFNVITGYFDDDTVKAIENHPDVSQLLL
jgi:hypothetical protein